MTSSLERRLSKLEQATHVGGDVAQARRVVNAYHAFFAGGWDLEALPHLVRQVVAAHSNADWQRAMALVIRAAGGLEAIVAAACCLPPAGATHRANRPDPALRGQPC